MSENSIQPGRVSFIGLLTLLFIALKLTGVTDWAWLWVLSPIIIFWALAIILALIVVSVGKK